MEDAVGSAELLPQLFTQMRCERCQQDSEGFEGFFVDAALFLRQIDELVVVLHETGDNGIQAELLETLLNVEYQFVAQFNHFLGLFDVFVLAGHNQVVETVQETGYALDTAVIPLCIQFRRSYEKLIETQGIAAIVAYQIIRGYDISFRLTHFDTILTSDHTLVEQLLERLVEVNNTDIAQELCVETGIQQMQYCMFNTADVHINRQIFVCFLTGYQFFIVLVIYIAQEVPGRSSPLRHGVCLTFCRSAAARAGGVDPLVDGCQRGFAGTSRLIAFYLRKF